jgi:hypothetical protein
MGIAAGTQQAIDMGRCNTGVAPRRSGSIAPGNNRKNKSRFEISFEPPFHGRCSPWNIQSAEAHDTGVCSITSGVFFLKRASRAFESLVFLNKYLNTYRHDAPLEPVKTSLDMLTDSPAGKYSPRRSFLFAFV